MNYKFKPSHIVPACLFVVAVLYGGSKPPSSTNEPPSDISCDLPTNNVDAASSPRQEDDIPTNPPPMMCMSPRPMMSAPPEPTTINQQLTTIPQWTARGAWIDWQRITFPDGFAFPAGTNLLTGVILMSYGEIRANLHSTPTPSIYTLPSPVSIEPDVSSVSYGITPSNSFLFAWQNVCVNRDPTNRVDASIELFRNGDLAITTTPLSTPTPPTYTYLPAVPPEGFVGQGQDTNWLAATFSPTDYAAITNKGYDAWLMEDKVGINVQNGLYKISVSIADLPLDEPCYLMCGPWKTIIREPGTYSFPLHVRTTYTIRTYPTPIPLAFTRDDGYRNDNPDPYGYLLAPMMLNAPHQPDPPIYEERQDPRFVVTPHRLPVGMAEGEELTIYFNDSGFGNLLYESLGDLILSFNGDKATIRRARVAQRARIMIQSDGETYSDEVEFFDGYYHPPVEPPSTNDTGNASSTNSTGNASSTNSTGSASNP